MRCFYLSLTFLITFILHSVEARAQSWKVATSDNFTVYSDGRDSELVNATKNLEKLNELMRRIMAIPPEVTADIKPKVFLMRSEAHLQSIARAKNILGFYTGSRNGPAIFSARNISESFIGTDPNKVLYHEYAHYFMFQYIPAYFPGWFVEGFAEFFSTVEFRKDGSVDIGRSNVSRILTLQYLQPMPTRKLFTQNPRTFSRDETQLLYAQGWLILQYFSNQPSVFKSLGDYFTRINNGEEPELAFQAAIGMSFEAFDQEIRRFFNKGKTFFRRLPPGQSKEYAVAVQTLSPVEQDFVETEFYFYTKQDPDKQKAILANAREKSQKHPNDPYANLMLAQAELYWGNADQALAKIKKIIEKEPDNPKALLLKAIYYDNQIRQTKDDARETLIKEARPWVVRANRANGDNPLPYLIYARLFSPENMPKAAFEGLMRAFELAPYLDETRFMLAHILAFQGHHNAAINMLNPIAADPHGGKGSEMAQDLIDSYKSKIMPKNAQTSDVSAISQ